MSVPAPYYHDVAEGPEGAGHYLDAADDIRIRAVTWAHPSPKGTIVIFPGRTEYCEKYSRIAGDLHLAGYAVTAVDWRGQGLSDRVHPDREAGHINDFAAYQNDVTAYLAFIDSLNLPGPKYLVAHSMGGCIGLRRLYGKHPFAAAIFSAPMWGINYPPMLRPFVPAVTWAAKTFGQLNRFAPGATGQNQVLVDPFAGNRLTTDRASWDWMRRQVSTHPGLSIGGPTLGWARAAEREMTDLAAKPAPDLPALTLLGGNERIVSAERIRTRMAEWPKGTLLDLPGLEHETLIEAPQIRQPIIQRIVTQLESCPL